LAPQQSRGADNASLNGVMVLFSVLLSAFAAPQIKVSLDCRLVCKLDAFVGAFWSYVFEILVLWRAGESVPEQ